MQHHQISRNYATAGNTRWPITGISKWRIREIKGRVMNLCKRIQKNLSKYAFMFVNLSSF